MPDSTRRAALYARFSTDLQSDRSIEDQFALCERYAASAGLSVTHHYEDRAKSSATLFGRDGLLSLIADAKARAFDVVVVEALDRISRDPADLHGLFKQLEFAGIAVEEVHRGRADALTIGINGLFGQLFLDQLKAKTRRGLAGVIRDGRSAGGRAYGYAAVPGSPGDLTIVEAEADIVRRIFDEYVSGASTREIVFRLNREGVPSPRGSEWRSNALTGNAARGYGILLNDLYRGERIWNRVRMVRDPDTGKRVSRVNPEDEWQRQAVPQLRIVPEALFQAAQNRRIARTRLSGEQRKRPARPLSGLITCDHCGGSITIRARRPDGAVYAACTNATQTGSCDQKGAIRLDQIEAALFDRLAELIRDPTCIQTYVTAYHEERTRLARETAKDRHHLERAASRARGAFDRATELYINGVMDGPEATKRLRELRATAEEAERALAETVPPPELVTLHPEATRRYLTALTDLAPALADTTTPEAAQAMATIREWISDVRVRHMGDEVHATVYGYLAALMQPTRLTAMVAWGGLEPPTPAL